MGCVERVYWRQHGAESGVCQRLKCRSPSDTIARTRDVYKLCMIWFRCRRTCLRRIIQHARPCSLRLQNGLCGNRFHGQNISSNTDLAGFHPKRSTRATKKHKSHILYGPILRTRRRTAFLAFIQTLRSYPERSPCYTKLQQTWCSNSSC
jgi:hypothetical protein